MKQASGSARHLHVALKTAAGRPLASQRWLSRQLNDPYVQAAHAAGFRSRSAYKLIELSERFHLIKHGARVLDLGAAPGGWSQAALGLGASQVLAVDRVPIIPLAGVDIIEGDAREPEVGFRIRAALAGAPTLVLSDMAPATTGHAPTDHARIMALAECAADIALELLAPGGAFVVKLFQGGAEAALLETLKYAFTSVKHAKPAASRADSRETYLVATGFRAHGRSGERRG